MPRGKKGQYALETDGNGRLTPTRVDGGSDSVPAVSGLQARSVRLETADESFAWLLARTDGWLRCIPAGDGKLNYFKWKFNSGPHRGKYVMFVGVMQDWAGSINGLVEKLVEVDQGMRRPALDQYGGDGWDVS